VLHTFADDVAQERLMLLPLSISTRVPISPNYTEIPK
jgi:hypothetical protein